MSSDYTDLVKAQQTMLEAVEEMDKLKEDVGKAKAVIEFSSEYRKGIIAVAMRRDLEAGESAAKAEALARANEDVHKHFRIRQDELEMAETTLAKWTMLRAKFEAARSIVSAEKSMISTL